MGQLASTRAATEVLAGLVERVTFHNEENGFCVLRVKARGQRDLITALGQTPARRLSLVPGVLAAAESQVRTGLGAGGKRIRTCMGLFLSSHVFGLLPVLCSERGKPFLVRSPAIRFAERADGVKGPKR
jgi:hypothetical protein